jgi:hypothetical protein
MDLTNQMNLKTGEIWVCSQPRCKAEMKVLRGAEETCRGTFTVRCCCGFDMTRKESLARAATPALAGAGTSERK